MGGLFGIYRLGGFWFSSLCMVGAGYSGMKTNGVFYLFFGFGCLECFIGDLFLGNPFSPNSMTPNQPQKNEKSAAKNHAKSLH